jgi:hypothetical protein
MKKNGLFIILIFIGYFAFAEIVPIETARKVAKNFYFERANAVKPISIEGIKITQEFIEFENNNPVLYIFNIGLDKGYIIISAESNTIPVLAYSFEKNYYKDNLPPAFNWIINSYKNEIKYTREKQFIATEAINQFWLNYSSENSGSVSGISQVLPLLGYISWDQDCYYNALTPANNDAAYCNHNPTGCVATAMAMIMKYNAWPTQGVGSYSYVHSTANQFPNNYGTLSANFGASTYNWAAMPISVTSANAEVAKIMYHCGVAVEMAYDKNGSGAVVGAPAGYQWPTAQKAFVNNFRYPLATYFAKSSFTDANWKLKIKAELDASRPILYAGDDGSAGHAFVLDGYQGSSNDYYHFNFGWSGYANGNFYITNINPNPGGIGGGSYNFTQNQEGIFNLIKGNTGIEEVSDNQVEVYPNPAAGLVNIDFKAISNNKAKIEIFNLIGEKVMEKVINANNNQLNLSSLTKGIYYISIKSESLTLTKKITIVE